MASLRLRALCSLLGLGLAVLVMSVDAAAESTTYYAAPSATRATGCTKLEPCSLSGAIAAAGTGATVQLASGTYQVTSALTVSKAVSIHGGTGAGMPEILGAPTLTKDLLALSDGASISAVHLRSEAPGSDALDLTGATGEDLILEETAPAPASGGHPPGAADLIASEAGTVLKDSVAWASGAKTEGVIARSGKTGAASNSIVLVNDTLIGSGAQSSGLSSSQSAGSDTVTNTILLGTAADITASAAGIVRIASSDLNPSASSGYTVGVGNVAAPAQFVSASTGNFRELASSPTVDAGVLSAPPTPTATRAASALPLTSAPTSSSRRRRSRRANLRRPPGRSAPTNTLTPPGGGVPQPTIGRTASIETVSGVVRVKEPSAGAYVPLGGTGAIPMGALVDASRGVARVRTALDTHGHTQMLTVWRGVFALGQSRDGNGLTRIYLRGQRPSCPRLRGARASSAGRRRTKQRSLWAKDEHGRYSTYGANSVATVLGTEWVTTDTCAGTITRVVRGKVRVRALHRHKSVIVHAGRSYLARR